MWVRFLKELLFLNSIMVPAPHYLPNAAVKENLELGEIIRGIDNQMQERGFSSQKQFFWNIPDSLAKKQPVIDYLEGHYNVKGQLFATVIYGANRLPKFLGMSQIE